MNDKELIRWFAVGLRGLGDMFVETAKLIENQLSTAPEQGAAPGTVQETQPPAPETGPSGETSAEPAPEPEPEPPKPSVSFEQLKAVSAAKSRKHTDQVRALVKKYGANKLSEVDPTNYEALLADVEAIE